MTTATTRTTWQLARLADVAEPDAPDGYAFPYVNDDNRATMHEKASPGAKWLRSVENDARELVERLKSEGIPADRADDDGSVHELADGAVPIYTHERWQVFVDLCAYQEDLDELGGTPSDMTEAAGVALYMVAERLIRAIVDEETTETDND